MTWESWCVACDGFLLGGEHFEGRLCGTCHGEALPARWELGPDNEAVLVIIARGYVQQLEVTVRWS